MAIAVVAAAVVGCERADDGEHTSRSATLGRSAEAIVGGSLDVEHRAVVAVIAVDDPVNPTKGETCTGTLLGVKGDTGYVLTAAHCFTEIASTWTTMVVTADEYSFGSITSGHKVTDHVVHPSYVSKSHIFDFAMLKFEGASGLPTMAPLPPASDDLAAASQVTIVGYGFVLADLQESDASANTSRREVTVPLDSVDTNQLIVNETTAMGGQCQGDSGGPLLYTKGGTVYVAGVVSAGAMDCTGLGLSNRVSPVLSTFVQPYLDDQPIMVVPTCDSCEANAVAAGQPCAKTYDACGNEADCTSFSQCNAKCSDDTCVQACRSAHAHGAMTYDAINTCLCTTECVKLCGADLTCPSPPAPADAGVETSDAAPTPPPASSSSSDGSSGGCSAAPPGRGALPLLSREGLFFVLCALAALRRKRRQPV